MLSILIPLFNHEKYIIEAIDRARLINVPGKKIIIIDDASTDGSIHKVEKYLSQNDVPDVRLIKKPVNMGLVDSINLFIEQCDTELTYMVASDDLVIPDGISELVNLMRKQEVLKFAIGGGFNLYEDNTLTDIYGKQEEKLFDRDVKEIFENLLVKNNRPLLIQTCIFRASFLKCIGGWDPIITSDDYQIFLKIFSRTKLKREEYIFLPRIKCVHYRHHARNSYRNLLRQVKTVIEVIEIYANEKVKGKAIGCRVSFFALMAVKRGEYGLAIKISKLARLRNIHWIPYGVCINLMQWIMVKNARN